MKKLSGETRLLLIMGIIVLAGGGYLAFSSGGGPPGPTETTPSPATTPAPMDAAKFESFLQSSRHRKGPKDGSKPDIAIIEFGDVECPSCRYAFRKVTKDFGEKIPVEFAFHHFPLPNHNFARPCAQALEAAAKQGKFWPLYHALFEEETPILEVTYIEERAKKVGLDINKFVEDSQNEATAKLVEDDNQMAQTMVITQTPTFIILNRKTKKVDFAVGSRELLEKLHGVPNVPAPDPPTK